MPPSHRNPLPLLAEQTSALPQSTHPLTAVGVGPVVCECGVLFKESTIKNIMEHCHIDVFNPIGEHCDKYAWRYGALSEVLLRNPCLWIGITLISGGALSSCRADSGPNFTAKFVCVRSHRKPDAPLSPHSFVDDRHTDVAPRWSS